MNFVWRHHVDTKWKTAEKNLSRDFGALSPHESKNLEVIVLNSEV